VTRNTRWVTWAVVLLLLDACASPSSPGESHDPSAEPSSSSPPAQAHTISGQVPHSPLLCPAHEGLDHAEVIIRDENDVIIGVGRVGEPAGIERNHFEIADLPDAAFYQVDVGDLLSRTFTRAELEADDWFVTIIEPCPT
jgi:hypothetical protein